MTETQKRFRERRRSLALALLLFTLSTVVYNASPGKQVSDSYYSMLLSESLLLGRGFALDDYFEVELDSARFPGIADDGELPYQIARGGEHLYYYFPAGSSLLSLPLVAVVRAAGISTIAADGGYWPRGERKMQRRIAPLLAAGFVVLAFATARLLLSPAWSAIVALCVGFGTQVWSTVAMAVWSHAWLLLLLGGAVLQLLGAETGRWKLRPLLLGSLLAWCFFTRPTGAIPLLGVGAYLMLQRRDAFWPYCAVVIAWLGLFALYSAALHGSALPPYYQGGRLGSASFFEALAGNLVSPARGVLVFVPPLLLVGYLLVRYRSGLRARALVILSCVMILVHWLVISSFPHWWGGCSYGPRLMTDVIPWQLVLALVALRAWLDERAASPTRASAGRLAALPAVLLVAWALMVHAGGALARGSMDWNFEPASVDAQPRQRLWDWGDPQFFAWARPRTRGSTQD